MRMLLLLLLPGVLLAQQPKPPYQRILSQDDDERAKKLATAMDAFKADGKYPEALKLAQELLDLRTKAQGADHWEVRDARHRVAFYSRPAPTAEQRKELAQAEQWEEELQTLYAKGQYPAALTLAEKILEVHRKVYGAESPDTVISMGQVASLQQSSGQYAKAEPTYRATLALNLKVFGEVHPETAMTKANLGTLLSTLGQNEEATRLQEDVLAVRRELFGPKHPRTAASLHNLGAFYQIQAKYPEAEAKLREALTLRQELLGKTDPATIITLAVLAGTLHHQTKDTAAEVLYREALQRGRERWRDGHPTLASITNDLGLVCVAQGKYTQAEEHLRAALALRQRFYSANHPDTAICLNNLGTLYHAQGRDADADALWQQAHAIRLAVYGPNHPVTATTLNNLAAAAEGLGNFTQAEDAYKQALAVFTRQYGPAHPRSLGVLRNLGNLALTREQYDTARTLLEQALAQAKDLPPQHPEVWRTQQRLALIHYRQRQDADATRLLRQVHEAAVQTLGAHHADTLQVANQLGIVLEAQGQYEQAAVVWQQTATAFEVNRVLRNRPLERSTGTTNKNPYPNKAAVAARLKQPTEAFLALERDLARGLLDEQASRASVPIPAAEQRQRTQCQDDLRAIEPRLLHLVLLPKPTPREVEERKTLTAQRERLAQTLAQLAAAQSEREVATLKAIQAALAPDAAFVAWVDVGDAAQRIAEHWGCVVRPTGPPQWVRLPVKEGTTAKLRDVLAGNGARADVATLANELHTQRLAPLLPHLQGVKRLHVAAVREMAGVPIEVLLPDMIVNYVPSATFLARVAQPLTTPATLLALGDPVFPKTKEAPVLHALPPNGVLITHVVPQGVAAQARLLANDVLVRYAGTELNTASDLNTALTKHAAAKMVTVQFWREGEAKLIEREVASGPLGIVLAEEPARTALAKRHESAALVAKRTRGTWDELPGTLVEVQELTQLFGKERTKVLTRSDANEAALHTLHTQGELAKFRYLHFATHGEANSIRAFDSKLILSQDRPTEPSTASDAPHLNNELSASEVLTHWKLNADLVTLSACETALGKASGGDGLLGFAQAFLLAGSRSVCVSLWKVDDTATALLMDRFYRNLLGRDGRPPLPKATALQEAKQWLRTLTVEEATQQLGTLTKGVSRGSKVGREILSALPEPMKTAKPTAQPFAHPKYWAAFILVGAAE